MGIPAYLRDSGLAGDTFQTGTILDRIAAKKAERIRARLERTPIEELAEKAVSVPAPDRSFARALRTQGLSVIAEVKRASPSKGLIAGDFRPAEQAMAYEHAGAAAISVLTEQDYFLGSDADLTEVVRHVSLPVLRKDFTIDPSQIYEARLLGASAVLLIAALLPDRILAAYMRLADELGLSTLLEVHSRDELMRALDLGAPIIGINNRNLHTFHVDLSVTERLAPLIPAERTIVSESGIHTASDISRCYRSGAHAVLIGESLMRAGEDSASGTPDGIPGTPSPGLEDRVSRKMHELLSGLPRK